MSIAKTCQYINYAHHTFPCERSERFMFRPSETLHIPPKRNASCSQSERFILKLWTDYRRSLVSMWSISVNSWFSPHIAQMKE